jgi:hypothetical protein
MAAEWSFYGSSRMSTFWTETDFDSADDEDLEWYQQGNSRIGANVKAGDVFGKFEYGTGINLRQLYGEWDFGAGKLLVGQTYTPVNIFVSNMVYGGDTDLLNSGGLYGGRQDMIRFRFGSLDVAFVEVNTAGLSGFAAADTDTTIPKLEARYLFKAAGFSAELNGGYQTYEVIDAADNGEDVDSWVLGFGAKLPLGPAYFKGNIYYGQNTGNYGLWQLGASAAAWDGTDIVDNETLGFALVAGFKMSDMVTFEAGYGHLEHELDQSGADKDDTQTYYAQAVLSLAKGVYIVPEIGVVDYLDNAAGNDEGDLTYFGAKWQINF